MKIFYQTFGTAKKKFSNFLNRFFKKKRTRIGIYGPPNAGKTTLANRIARDWTGDAVGPGKRDPARDPAGTKERRYHHLRVQTAVR